MNTIYKDQTTAEYLHAFFEEKDLPSQTWTINHNGLAHIISSDFVIQTILELCNDDEQSKVVGVIRTLDFHNAPVMPFLEHLAEALVVSGYAENATGWERGEWMED